MSLEKDKGDDNKMFSYASVILSAGEIDSQVRSLKTRLLLFGLVLIGLGSLTRLISWRWGKCSSRQALSWMAASQAAPSRAKPSCHKPCCELGSCLD